MSKVFGSSENKMIIKNYKYVEKWHVTVVHTLTTMFPHDFCSWKTSCVKKKKKKERKQKQLILMHSERPKLYTILAFLSAIGLSKAGCMFNMSKNYLEQRVEYIIFLELIFKKCLVKNIINIQYQKA